jgi:hypothetical protein
MRAHRERSETATPKNRGACRPPASQDRRRCGIGARWFNRVSAGGIAVIVVLTAGWSIDREDEIPAAEVAQMEQAR